MALAKDTTTIEEFIKVGKSVTMDYMNFSFLERLQNGTWVSSLNVINDYIDEFRSVSINVELNTSEQYAYFYKPKLLCYDVYGNPEIYYIILLINDMADVKEFCKSVIKLPKKDHMNTMLSLIYNAEYQSIKAYNSKYMSEG